MKSLAARVSLVPIVAAVVLLGIWVAGGLITNNFRAAMALTTTWLLLAGAAALGTAIHRRSLALPVFGTFIVTACVAGGYLLYASNVDQVLHERIAVVPPESARGPGEPPPAAPVNTVLARGSFTSVEHHTSGTVTAIRLAGGGTVLAIERLDTSPGPDLRVYLVAGSTQDLGDTIDLGQLKGNKGDQQYRVPRTR